MSAFMNSFAGMWPNPGPSGASPAGASGRGNPTSSARSQIRKRAPGERAVVYVVGITGHGKSRLGSFMISPEDTHYLVNEHTGIEGSPAFTISCDPSSCTQLVASNTTVFEGVTYEFVDTPGFYENPEKDLEHTVMALEQLKASGSISAIVFCFREGKVEENERRLISFLKNLFGDQVLANNLMLVVTHVSRSPTKEKERMRKGTSVDTLMKATSARVQEAFGLKQGMITIDIDTGAEPGGKEWAIALQKRADIFRAIGSLPVVKIQNMTVPKTPELLLEDEKEKQRIEMQIQDKLNELQTANQEDSAILEKIKGYGAQINEVLSKMAANEEKLEKYDTDELEKTGFDRGYRPTLSLIGGPLEIAVTSDFPIAEHKAWVRDDTDTWEVLEPSEYKRVLTITPANLGLPVSGIGGAEGTLTVYSKSRDKHADKIEVFKERKGDFEKEKERLEQRIAEQKERSKYLKEEFTSELQAEIEAMRARISHLSKATMTIEDASARLEQSLNARGRSSSGSHA